MLEINLHPFPLLHTPRLLLRQMDERDIDEVFFLRSHPETMQYIGVPLAKSVDEIESLVRKTKEQAINNEGAAWALTVKNEPGMIGIAAYRRFVKEHYRGEIGYALHPSFRGMNYMYEALASVIDYGFQTLGLHSIEANVDKENTASIKLLERLSFRREAHFRENYYFEGKFIDSVIYSLVAQ